MATLRHTPHTPLAAIIVAGLVARLPLVMVSLTLVLVVRDAGHGFGVVGVTSGAYVIGTGAASPFLGRLADRLGGRPVLLASGAACSLALAGIAAGAGGGLGAPGLVVLAAVAGAATPPVVAVLRALLPGMAVGDALRRLFGLEAALQEVLFVAGPLAVVALVALVSPAWALGVCAAGVAAGTVGFAWAAAAHAAPPRGGDGRSPLRSAGLRATAATYALVGVTFGAIEIGTIAALDADGHRDLAGVVLAAWAAGSLAGGLVVALRRGRRDPGARLPGLLAALAVLGVPLALASAHPVTLAMVLAAQGVAIAPTLGTIYELVPRVVPAEALTEAFAWTTSAVFAGVALGTTTAGLLAGAGGAAWAFALPVAAPLLGIATARLARREERALRPEGAGCVETSRPAV